jgi:predicted Zn-dependent protease
MQQKLEKGLIILCLVGGLALALIWATACEKIHEPDFRVNWKWLNVPISVQMEDDPSLGWEKELKTAVRRWNDDVGCDIFVVVDAGAVVKVVHGGSHPTMRGGTTAILINQIPNRATIEMYNVGQNDKAYIVLLHELGRVLGLDDDPQSCSAMNRNVVECDVMRVRITDKDRKAVRRRYCH